MGRPAKLNIDPPELQTLLSTTVEMSTDSESRQYELDCRSAMFPTGAGLMWRGLGRAGWEWQSLQ
jgi:hypothetical protein